jgi:glycosyltransferase involved in cell wall biosynthesis
MTEDSPQSSVLGGRSSANRASGPQSSVIRPQPSAIGGRSSQLPASSSQLLTSLRVALLTGGGDKPYALGIAEALTEAGVKVDFIGSDELAVSSILQNKRIKFLNLRGDQRPQASALAKLARVLRYYVRLLRYAAGRTPPIFHLLWNNKFEFFDRTALMLYYRLLGKRIVLTVHNVNARTRDGNDSDWNRLSLRMQYRLADHLFVHTEKMKTELRSSFAVPSDKVDVIPFGINNTLPKTSLSSADAKGRLGVPPGSKTLLFFGNIAPYKGLDCLVHAFAKVARKDPSYRLIIAGRLKCSLESWRDVEQAIEAAGVRDQTIQRIAYIPDEEAEWYFKAADVLVLPYRSIFQSGVLFLGYSFGLPALVSDVGSLKEEIVEGETGFVFCAEHVEDMARVITRYFESDLYPNLESRRGWINDYANDRYSWTKVAAVTTEVYQRLV